MPTPGATPSNRIAMLATHPPDLLERDAPLQQLQQLLQALRAGQGACVVLHGEAGVGKTSLLQAARQRFGAGLRWLVGGCEPLMSPPPLGALLDFLDQLPPSLALAVRSGGAAPQVLAGMLELLRESRPPTVLVIEDTQWADSATLDLLRYLGRRMAGTRALLVLSHRDEALDAHHPLRAVLGGLPSSSTRRLALAVLSPQAVQRWAEQAGSDAEALYRASGGNPFFVSELLASPGLAMPATVRDTVLARAAQLPVAARELLDLVSVAPSHVEHELLDALVPDAGSALAPCVAAGLLVNQAHGVQFRHELGRQAVESALQADWARRLHSTMFEALSGLDVSVARRVHHAERAGLDGPLRRLLPLAAGEAAAASAHRQAAQLYGAALLRCDDLPAPQRLQLLEAHSDECLLTNQVDEALQSRQQAQGLYRSLGDRVGEGTCNRLMARLAWMRSGTEAALPLARAAIALLQDDDGPRARRELALAHATLAQLLLLSPDTPLALHEARRAEAMARSLGDPEVLCFTLNSLACAQLRTQDDPQAWQHLEHSLALALQQQLEEHAARAYLNLPTLGLVHRRYDAVRAWCVQGLAYCQARDLDVYTVKIQLRRAYADLETGRWAELDATLAQMATEPALSPLEREQSHHLAMLLALRRGDPAARGYWDEVMDGRRRLSVDPWHAPQAVACTEAAWLAGRSDHAVALAHAALPAVLAAGEAWQAGQLACWLQRLDDRSPRAGLASATLAPPCAAEWAGQREQAAQRWQDLGCVYEQALVLAFGDSAQQRRALVLLDRLQAGAAATWLRRQLRRRGERGVARGPYRHSRNDPQGLTAREREVLSLLRQGLSNRDIAARLSRSERTVENHVAALLAKLGLGSRAEVLARGGEDDPA